jgi:hypothetical protein
MNADFILQIPLRAICVLKSSLYMRMVFPEERIYMKTLLSENFWCKEAFLCVCVCMCGYSEMNLHRKMY